MFDGARLQALRDDRRWTRRHVAIELGITEATIYRWETGQNQPRFDQVVALCRLFKCGLIDLTKEGTRVYSNSAFLVALSA